MVAVKVFRPQSAANAALQASDAETAAPWLHARRFPYRGTNSVDFGVGGKSHDTDVIVVATCAIPVCLFAISALVEQPGAVLTPQSTQHQLSTTP